MKQTTAGWRLVHIGFEGDSVEISGISPSGLAWGTSSGTITVAHPQYPHQRHTMLIYDVDTTEGVVTFAAGEFSNGVWGLFEPVTVVE
jgi:hypothetical protein